jgi:hypothetical protein
MEVFRHQTLFWRALDSRTLGGNEYRSPAAHVLPGMEPSPAPSSDAALASDPPLTAHGKLASLDDDAQLSARHIAALLGLAVGAVRKRMDRHRKKNHDCFVEVDSPKPRQARFLYRIGSIRHVLLELVASSERPSK